MNLLNTEIPQSEYSVVYPALHTLHECGSVDEFCQRFEAATGRSAQHVADHVVEPSAPKAIFLVGSLPLGMATSGSDVDLIVLVDSKTALLNREGNSANSEQHLEFSTDNDVLQAGMFVTLFEGILVDLQVAITPAIHRIQSRLRRRGPELSEGEVRTLGRLSTGWLLWQSAGYLEGNALSLNDPALSIYCCTKNFVTALIQLRKATKTLEHDDIPLTLQLGRSSVEMAYLAYFASEGFAYLGCKWLAQIGYARGAAQRVSQHPLLKEGVRLLFPAFESTPTDAAQYLQAVREFHAAMQGLIEKKILFRIAFKACPQIVST
jgi:hypothetical protein